MPGDFRCAIVARTLGGVYSTFFENEEKMDQALRLLRQMTSVKILKEYRNEDLNLLRKIIGEYVE